MTDKVKNLPIFTEDPVCSKCGWTNITTAYAAGRCLTYDLLPCHKLERFQEHMHRRCLRCGYEWIENVLRRIGTVDVPGVLLEGELEWLLWSPV